MSNNYNNGIIIAAVDIIIFVIWGHLIIKIVKYLKLKTKYDLFKQMTDSQLTKIYCHHLVIKNDQEIEQQKQIKNQYDEINKMNEDVRLEVGSLNDEDKNKLNNKVFDYSLEAETHLPQQKSLINQETKLLWDRIFLNFYPLYSFVNKNTKRYKFQSPLSSQAMNFFMSILIQLDLIIIFLNQYYINSGDSNFVLYAIGITTVSLLIAFLTQYSIVYYLIDQWIFVWNQDQSLQHRKTIVKDYSHLKKQDQTENLEILKRLEYIQRNSMLDDAIMFGILILLILTGYSLYILGYSLGDNSVVFTLWLYTFVLDVFILRIIFCFLIYLFYKLQFSSKQITVKCFIDCEVEFQKFQQIVTQNLVVKKMQLKRVKDLEQIFFEKDQLDRDMTDDDYQEFLKSKRVRIANRFKDLKISKQPEEKIEYDVVEVPTDVINQDSSNIDGKPVKKGKKGDVDDGSRTAAAQKKLGKKGKK